MMRDYAICVKEGYTAGEYAEAWAEDLYYQLYDSAFDFFWGENYDDAEEHESNLTISEAIQAECLELCFYAYEEAYRRYEESPEENFEEWEVQDATHEVLNLLCGHLEDRLKELKEYGENKE